MSLEFENESYETVLARLRKRSELWKELHSISRLKEVRLKAFGNNEDLDNFQVFTPRFIVADMLKAIGDENIANVDHRILEPASGDGAFTCRILELRLKKIDGHDPKAVFEDVLRSLATIYSIELDEGLVQEQRSNIYTLAVQYLADRDVELSESEDVLLRLVVHSNFIWGETNIDLTPTLLDCDVASKMPEARRGERVSVRFPVWRFEGGRVSLRFEAPELGG